MRVLYIIQIAQVLVAEQHMSQHVLITLEKKSLPMVNQLILMEYKFLDMTVAQFLLKQHIHMETLDV